MQTRIRLGGNTRIRLRDKIAQEHQINDGDLYSMDVTPSQILLTKLEEQSEQTE